jgi:predicted glycoside hydrolase/deacetylase ChbG (UPF0249 family)
LIYLKTLLITADDFGVFPSINEGIRSAVLKGKVNSVAVLPNYKDSVKNTKELLEVAGNKVEIGCHLTITSGKPFVATTDTFMSGSSFRSFDNLKITSIEKNLDLLEKELRAQVQSLMDHGIEVKHLSSHHGTLCFTQKIFDVYAKVAKEFKLPFRSVNIFPEGKDNMYRNVLQLLLADNVPASKLAEIKRFGKEITGYKKENYSEIATPSLLESSHYGPPPFVEVADARVKQMVRKKHSLLEDFFEGFTKGENSSAELMLHLIKDDIRLYEQDDDIDYSGISRKYFDSRNVESRSIENFNLERYFDRLKLGRWSEI